MEYEFMFSSVKFYHAKPVIFAHLLNAIVIVFLFVPIVPVHAQSQLGLNSDGISRSSASIGTQYAPDFFVVNSKPCPQKANGCIPSCNGAIHRFLPDHRYHQSDMNSLLASLKPGVPVCVVVHGSFVRSEELYSQSIQRYKRILSADNDRPIHFIAAHWPSDPGLMLMPCIQVNQLGERAEFNGIYLAQLIRRIPPENPVSLIGHSHGCRVIASALHLLGGGCIQGNAVANPYPHRRMRVVFGAGAVNQNWLNPGERYGCALNSVECLLNFKNRSDCILKMYSLTTPLLSHAIGQAGFRHQDLNKIGYQASKISECDVTHLVGSGHMVSHYARHPQIRATYLPYIYFD